MNMTRKLLALLLCLCAVLSLTGPALAAEPAPFFLSVRVEGGGESRVRAYEDNYPGNLYLSLSDLSRALSGTTKQFLFSHVGTDDSFTVTTGRPAAAAEGEPTVRERGGAVYLDLLRNRIFVDGGERRYYTYRRGGEHDLYMSLTDIQLVLDLTASWEEDGALLLDPSRPFEPDIHELAREEYFGAVNALVLGDADTGEILFNKEGNRSFPVASLSKLMSYLLLCEAAERM